MEKKKTLLLIDSFAIIFRAYYAFPPTLLSPKGEPTNAVYGFTSILMDVLSKFRPDNVIAVFDSEGPTFRKSEHSFYKANREEADDIFKQQIPMVKEVLESFSIPVLSVNGFEADDIIATIDKRHSGQWAKTIIVTGDQDLFQLVDLDTFVYLSGRRFSESKLFDEAGVKEKMGVTPAQITDYKALKGDPSDNIPGVKGIGEKTAIELLGKYNSLDGIYNNLFEITGATQKKLSEGYEMAKTSYKLAAVITEVPISFDFTESKFSMDSGFDTLKIMDELGFRSLKEKFHKLANAYGTLMLESDKELSVEDNHQFTLKDSEPFLKTLSSSSASPLFALFEIGHLDKSPIHWTLQKAFLLDAISNTYSILNPDEFFQNIEKIFAHKIITVEIKQLFHALINKNISYEKLNWEDIGLLGFLESMGESGSILKSIIKYYVNKELEDTASALFEFPKVYDIQLKAIVDKNMQNIVDIEKSALYTILNMEQTGIIFDSREVKEIQKTLSAKSEELRTEIFKEAGENFNINSPSQVSKILFNKLNLPGGQKTKGGAFSTNEANLKKIAGAPIVASIMEYREVEKLLSTYVNSIPSFVDEDTRIRAIFDQFGAVTGRFASRKPNLQNIPKEPTLGINFRNLFKSAPNSIFLSFDYSQQELRILAALSKEREMLDAFNAGTDIHVLTASKLFGVEQGEVTSLQRKVGKSVNFSVIYGISAFGLSERLSIPRAEATIFIKKFFDRYPQIQNFINLVLEGSRKNGYVETVLGRRRFNPMINSNNKMLRSAAERELFNFVVQGTAADIMKKAISKFKTPLKTHNANLLLQIHDEFLFEIEGEHNSDNTRNFVSEISKIMLKPLDIGVKYNVDVSWGQEWGNLIKYSN